MKKKKKLNNNIDKSFFLSNSKFKDFVTVKTSLKSILKNYNKVYTKIQKLDCNNRKFIEKHDKLMEEIHDCIDDMENLFGYAIKLINDELSAHAVIEHLETDPEKVQEYTKDDDKLSLMLNLYSRLYMVRRRRLTNYYNNLIVDTKFITEMTNYLFNKMNEYLEKNSNSTKGNNMILFGKLTKSKKPKKLEEFKNRAIENLALDGSDNLTYLAPTRVNLNLTMESSNYVNLMTTMERRYQVLERIQGQVPQLCRQLWTLEVNALIELATIPKLFHLG
jgi:hypothetical protein